MLMVLAGPHLQKAGEEMVELGLPKIISMRMLQSYGDEDLPELLAWVDEELANHIQVT